MGADHLPTFRGFEVFEGRAVIIGADNTIMAHVFDGKGRRLGSHDCRGVPPPHGDAAMLLVDGQVVVTNVLQWKNDGNVDTSVCAFRADGKGATKRRAFPVFPTVFAHAGVLYIRLMEDGSPIYRLDRDLRPVGRPVQDPRPAEGPEEPRWEALCDDFSEKIVKRWLWPADVAVMETTSCCGYGGRPGVFLCEAGPEASPRFSRPAAFAPHHE